MKTSFVYYTDSAPNDNSLLSRFPWSDSNKYRLYRRIEDSDNLQITDTIDSYSPSGAVLISHNHQNVCTQVGRDYLNSVISTCTLAASLTPTTPPNVSCSPVALSETHRDYLGNTDMVTLSDYVLVQGNPPQLTTNIKSRTWFDHDFQGRGFRTTVAKASYTTKGDRSTGQIVTESKYDVYGNCAWIIDPDGKVSGTDFNRRNMPVASKFATNPTSVTLENVDTSTPVWQFTSGTGYDWRGNTSARFRPTSTSSSPDWYSSESLYYDAFDRGTYAVESSTDGHSGAVHFTNYTIYGTNPTTGTNGYNGIVDVKETGRLNCEYHGSGTFPTSNVVAKTTVSRDAWHRAISTDNYVFATPGSTTPSVNHSTVAFLPSGQVSSSTQNANTSSSRTYNTTYDTLGRTVDSTVWNGTQPVSAVYNEYYNSVIYTDKSNNSHPNCTAVWTLATNIGSSGTKYSANLNISGVLNNWSGTCPVDPSSNNPPTAPQTSTNSNGEAVISMPSITVNSVTYDTAVAHSVMDVRGMTVAYIAAEGTGAEHTTQNFFDAAGYHTQTIDCDSSGNGIAKITEFSISGQPLKTYATKVTSGVVSTDEGDQRGVMRYAYDSAGRCYQTISGYIDNSGYGQNSETQTTTFDAKGNVQEIDRSGHDQCGSSITDKSDSIYYVRDELNRVRRVGYKAYNDSNFELAETIDYDDFGTVNSDVLYDYETNTVTLQPWGTTQTAGTVKSSVASTHGTDGRILSETQTVGSTSVTIDSSYTASGFRQSASISGTSDARITTLGWDEGPNGNPANLKLGDQVIATYAYYGSSMLASRINQNGTVLGITYDVFGRVQTYGTTSIASFAYGYDDLSRRIWQQYQHDNNKYSFYVYNANNFLTNAYYNCPAPTSGDPGLPENPSSYTPQDSFNFDAGGNRTTASIRNVSHTYQGDNGSGLFSGGNANNQYNSITIGTASPITPYYDFRGNLTNDGTHSYDFDYKDRLTTVDSTAASYAYDAQNRRLTKTVGSATTRFVYDGWQCRQERDGSNRLQRDYLWGNNTDEIVQMRDYAAGLVYGTASSVDTVNKTVTVAGNPYTDHQYKNKAIFLWDNGGTRHEYIILDNGMERPIRSSPSPTRACPGTYGSATPFTIDANKATMAIVANGIVHDTSGWYVLLGHHAVQRDGRAQGRAAGHHGQRRRPSIHDRHQRNRTAATAR